MFIKLWQVGRMEFYIVIKNNGLKEYLMIQEKVYNILIYKVEYKIFFLVVF